MPGVSSGQSLHAARDTKLNCHSPPEVSLTVPQDIHDHTIVVLLGQLLTEKKYKKQKVSYAKTHYVWANSTAMVASHFSAEPCFLNFILRAAFAKP